MEHALQVVLTSLLLQEEGPGLSDTACASEDGAPHPADSVPYLDCGPTFLETGVKALKIPNRPIW